ncbi:MAG: DUF502 domain-containing protein [Nitrospinae bacterium]|nr:DUF502 domain-containing protein [Nitrospinota bacterium]
MKKNLITGLLVLLPAGLTYIVLAFVVNGVDRAMSPLIAQFIRLSGLPLPEDFRLPGQGFLLIFIILFVAGLAGSNFFGRKLVALGEFILHKIPFVRTLYVSAKKAVEAISRAEAASFRQMVLVDYPMKGMKSLGVVCSDVRGELARHIGEDRVAVFVPTAPNVTAGFLIMVPRDEIIPLDIAVEKGFETIISLGTTTLPSPARKPGPEGQGKKEERS